VASVATRRLTGTSEQRRWERKADAYTTIFEAFHNVERWYEKHLEAAQQEREISDERKRRLQEDAKKAEEDLERCLAGQVWNLPEDFRRRASRLTSNLSTFGKPEMMWHDYLEGSLALIQTAAQELNSIAQKDLRVNNNMPEA
jgi:hypothetical protein